MLVNLAKGKTGEVNAKLLGLIIVAKLQMAAMGRADLPEENAMIFIFTLMSFKTLLLILFPRFCPKPQIPLKFNHCPPIYGAVN